MANAAVAGTSQCRVQHLARDYGLVCRHHDRVVRLLHFRQPDGHPGAEVLSYGQRHVRLPRLSRDLRGRLPGEAFRRTVLRPHRRPGGAQVCLYRDPLHHGFFHLCHRPVALIQNGRLVRTDRAAVDPRPAGTGAGRRIWRRCGLRGRACPRQQARLLHQLHPDHGDAGSFRLLDRDSGYAKLDVEGRICRLGLAHSFPGLHHPGAHLALHPPEDEGVAHLRAAQERRA